MKTDIIILGQCFFTYRFVEEYLRLGGRVSHVCVPTSGADNDPFASFTRQTNGENDWLSIHRLYHSEWRLRLANECDARGVPLISTQFPVTELPKGGRLIVAGYSRKIPSYIRAAFPDGAFNIHPSLLPAYRGPQPEAQVILSGEHISGVSIHGMTDYFDQGPLYYQQKYLISPQATVADMETIGSRLAAIGASRLCHDSISKCSVNDKSGCYFSAYSSSILDLQYAKDIQSAERLIRLRPEGYAFFQDGNAFIYPLQIGFDRRSNSLTFKCGREEFFIYHWVRNDCHGWQEFKIDTPISHTIP